VVNMHKSNGILNNTARKVVSLATPLLIMLICTCTFAMAADQSGTTGSDDSRSARILKGGVTDIEVTLTDLRDARMSTGRLRKAVANLYDEVTRQEMTMSFNPNVIGSTVITTPTPMATGRYLEPRKKWVDESMADIGPIIKLFKEDVDKALEDDKRAGADDAIHDALGSIKEELFSQVKSSFETYTALEGMTAGPGYDNSTIASTAKILDNDMKKLDRSLKKGISILQKEAKATKRLMKK
jgi:hypothetical protein